jgi:hypothetical protein
MKRTQVTRDSEQILVVTACTPGTSKKTSDSYDKTVLGKQRELSYKYLPSALPHSYDGIGKHFALSIPIKKSHMACSLGSIIAKNHKPSQNHFILLI